jgi:hypothetical protein
MSDFAVTKETDTNTLNKNNLFERGITLSDVSC